MRSKQRWRLLLASALFSGIAAAADIVVECEPQRVVGDKRYWSYRIVDGRTCWYPGRPGKPKTELRWPTAALESDHRNRASEAEQPRDVGTPPLSEAAPAPPPEELTARAPVPKKQDRLEPEPLTEEAVLAMLAKRQEELPPMPPMPQSQPVRERMPVWALALTVITIIGAAFLLPIIPRSMKWLNRTDRH